MRESRRQAVLAFRHTVSVHNRQGVVQAVVADQVVPCHFYGFNRFPGPLRIWTLDLHAPVGVVGVGLAGPGLVLTAHFVQHFGLRVAHPAPEGGVPAGRHDAVGAGVLGGAAQQCAVFLHESPAHMPEVMRAAPVDEEVGRARPAQGRPVQEGPSGRNLKGDFCGEPDICVSIHRPRTDSASIPTLSSPLHVHSACSHSL